MAAWRQQMALARKDRGRDKPRLDLAADRGFEGLGARCRLSCADYSPITLVLPPPASLQLSTPRELMLFMTGEVGKALLSLPCYLAAARLLCAGHGHGPLLGRPVHTAQPVLPAPIFYPQSCWPASRRTLTTS